MWTGNKLVVLDDLYKVLLLLPQVCVYRCVKQVFLVGRRVCVVFVEDSLIVFVSLVPHVFDSLAEFNISDGISDSRIVVTGESVAFSDNIVSLDLFVAVNLGVSSKSFLLLPYHVKLTATLCRRKGRVKPFVNIFFGRQIIHLNFNI